MERSKLKVCWISAGISSFVAGWLVRDTVDKFMYIDIADQHDWTFWLGGKSWLDWLRQEAENG